MSVLGTRISGLALPLLVLDITHSAAQAGFITSARLLPYLVLGLPAGALVDRWNRKTTMLACEVARFIALGSVPLAWYFGSLSLVQLYVVALVQGSAFVFFNVAEISCLPTVVSKEDLPQAIALDSLAGSAGSLVGPGIAGAIISAAKTTTVGAVTAYLVDSVSYLLSLVALLFIRLPLQSERSEEARHSLKEEVLDGLRFVWSNPLLRALTVTSWMLSFLYAPVSLAMIVLARDHLQASARDIGLIFSLSAIGGIIGASLAAKLNARFTIGQIVIGTIVLQALVTPVVGLATSTLMMTIGWGIAFMLDPIFSSASSAYRLAHTPDEMQGRAQSIYRLGGFGSEPLGAALGGVMLEQVGPRTEILAVAVGVTLCAIGVCFTKIRTAARNPV